MGRKVRPGRGGAVRLGENGRAGQGAVSKVGLFREVGGGRGPKPAPRPLLPKPPLCFSAPPLCFPAPPFASQHHPLCFSARPPPSSGASRAQGEEEWRTEGGLPSLNRATLSVPF